MTTQAPAPYLGQFVDADTEVDLGGISYYLVQLAPDGSRRILDDSQASSYPLRMTWQEVRDGIYLSGQGATR